MKKILLILSIFFLAGCGETETMLYIPHNLEKNIIIHDTTYTFLLSELWKPLPVDKNSGELFVFQSGHQNLIIKHYQGNPQKFQQQALQTLSKTQFEFNVEKSQNNEITQLIIKPNAESTKRRFFQRFIVTKKDIKTKNSEFLLFSCSQAADLPITINCIDTLMSFGEKIET